MHEKKNYLKLAYTFKVSTIVPADSTIATCGFVTHSQITLLLRQIWDKNKKNRNIKIKTAKHANMSVT